MTYPRETIRTRRLEAGLTQRKLAEAIDCKIETLRSWEQGHFYPNEQNQERLDEILGKPERTEGAGAMKITSIAFKETTRDDVYEMTADHPGQFDLDKTAERIDAAYHNALTAAYPGVVVEIIPGSEWRIPGWLHVETDDDDPYQRGHAEVHQLLEDVWERGDFYVDAEA